MSQHLLARHPSHVPITLYDIYPQLETDREEKIAFAISERFLSRFNVYFALSPDGGRVAWFGLSCGSTIHVAFVDTTLLMPYKGLRPAGVAVPGIPAAVTKLSKVSAAHEIGHALGRYHAPGHNAANPDGDYPYPTLTRMVVSVGPASTSTATSPMLSTTRAWTPTRTT